MRQHGDLNKWCSALHGVDLTKPVILKSRPTFKILSIHPSVREGEVLIEGTSPSEPKDLILERAHIAELVNVPEKNEPVSLTVGLYKEPSGQFRLSISELERVFGADPSEVQARVTYEHGAENPWKIEPLDK